MATVHPSRMGLVPQNNNISSYRSRSRSPRREYSQRNRSESRGRERERDGRRYSPEYSEYTTNELNNAAPWHSQNNMYPERRGGQRDNAYQTGSTDYFTHRQQLRDNKQVSIWPPSPKRPARDESPRRKSHKRSRRHERSPTPSSETDSEEEQRRKRKTRKRREKEERHESKRRRHERRERTRTPSKSVEASDRERRHRSKTKTRSPSPESDIGKDEDWVEKPTTNAFASATAMPESTFKNGALETRDEDSDTEFGPQPVTKLSAKVDERAYGTALLRGEGSAMAAFLAEDTNARIPRRGEIGLTSDEIASYEAAGYVMSGNRHRRMNAVRLRKENQVISAEEKRGILKLQKEERSRREELLREEFKELMKEKLKAAGTKPSET
ncbi:hypothetical protein Clacol_000738 [Clathrus columnatus]|uniref:NF-kappa-B-activating protein C-terminal domain-containing protein n=1 Tax=Clathrus columnatus TaxID=1419009 RepID=A0AAV5A1S8_9AGAM|nr:hypothetical protein Clacol_000738 [Clathrus columnatus]